LVRQRLNSQETPALWFRIQLLQIALHNQPVMH